jgi:ABC-type multidrug transport system ATPase subunit
MKVRSIYFNDFRNFRGEHTISFVNELTGDVHPMSALAGSNGSGKTTVLECIRALVAMAATRMESGGEVPLESRSVAQQAWESGCVCLELELTREETTAKRVETSTNTLYVAVGRADYLPADHEQRWPRLISSFRSPKHAVWQSVRDPAADALVGRIEGMYSGSAPFHGGLVYLPSDRSLGSLEVIKIEEPPKARPWVDTVSGGSAWGGNLEQYWVWLNYLDLEQGRDSGTTLRPLVERLQSVLGRDRRLTVKEGRVRVSTRSNAVPPVRLQHLPSGEKQLLLILGELVRRARKGLLCLVDEPELSLHPSSQHALIGALRGLSREYEMQFILATHSLDVVQALPTSVIFLDHLEHAQAPQDQEAA